MIWALYIATILVLCILAIQDWRQREVSVLLLIVYGGLIVAGRMQFVSLEQWLNESGTNLFLLGLQLGLTWAYFRIRRQKGKQSLLDLLGSGDVIFIAILATGMPTPVFLLMLIIGCLSSVISHLMVIRFSPKQDRGVPLITYWFPVACVFLFAEGVQQMSNSLNSFIVG